MSLKIRLILAVVLSLASLAMLPRLQVESDMNAAIEPPQRLDGSQAAEMLDGWQSPALVLHVASRDGDAERFLATLSDLVFELQFEDGVEEVVSIFSLTPSDSAPGNPGDGLAAALRGDSPAQQALAQLRSSVPFADRFVSADLASTVVMARGPGDALEPLLARYTRCADGAPICMRPIGSIAIEADIEAQLKKDNAILPLLTGLVSVVVIALWFGQLTLAVKLMAPPAFGVLWYLGVIALAGVPMDVFNTLVPTVLLTLGLADMLHLKRATDISPTDGARTALRSVLPAISITTVTTILAFASLALEGSVPLKRLALCGALGVSLLWLAVVILGPLATGTGGTTLRRGCNGRGATARVLRAMRRQRHRRRTVLALTLVAALGGMLAVSVTPAEFRFEENLPKGETADGIRRAADAGLATSPLFVVATAGSPDRQAAILEAIYGQGPDAASGLAPDVAAGAPAATDVDLAAATTDDGTMVLPYPIPMGMSARELEALAQALQARLPDPTEGYIGGYPILAADTILRSIERLVVVLIVCFIAQAIILGVVLRSAGVAAKSLLVNLMPILLIFVAIAFMSGGLNVSAAVAMIIASGIVVDDTAHILWASRGGGGRRKGAEPLRIMRGLRRSAEPVTLTTLVLVAGFSLLGLSGLPGLQTMGVLLVLALVVAWVTDIFVMPALWKDRP